GWSGRWRTGRPSPAGSRSSGRPWSCPVFFLRVDPPASSRSGACSSARSSGLARAACSRPGRTRRARAVGVAYAQVTAVKGGRSLRHNGAGLEGAKSPSAAGGRQPRLQRGLRRSLLGFLLGAPRTPPQGHPLELHFHLEGAGVLGTRRIEDL